MSYPICVDESIESLNHDCRMPNRQIMSHIRDFIESGILNGCAKFSSCLHGNDRILVSMNDYRFRKAGKIAGSEVGLQKVVKTRTQGVQFLLYHAGDLMVIDRIKRPSRPGGEAMKCFESTLRMPGESFLHRHDPVWIRSPVLCVIRAEFERGADQA